MAHALFNVATKAFVEEAGKILVLTTPNGFVDFPGGRLDDTEYDLPLKEGLKRELAEELGQSIQYAIGKTLFVTKRDWEAKGKMMRIMAIFYSVTFHGGEIQLSDEHRHHEWLTPQELLSRKDNFVCKDEYERVAEYLQSKT